MYWSVKKHAVGFSSRRSFTAVIQKLQQRMRKRNRTAMGAFRARLAASNRFDEVVWSRPIGGIFKHSPRSSGIDTRVVVGAADECFEPRSLALWSNAVLRRKALNEFGRQ